jgi:predicted metalloprotease
MSRSDARAMAAQVQPGQAALIVVGIDEDSAKVEQATGASLSHLTKHLEGSDFDEAEREAMESLQAQEAVGV